MSTNSQIIEQILDRRLGRNGYADKGRLQKITNKIKDFTEIQEKVKSLDALVSKINSELTQGSGQYYTLLQADPEAMTKFGEVNCKSATDSLKCVLDELRRLEERFKRPALRIAFIGRERQGKSTFLKTITGLNDKVIPAYSGDSCTGAVSVIHNQRSSMRVDVAYYNTDEFLKIVKDKISSFYSNPVVLRCLSDIKTLPPLENEDASLEYSKFKDAYIDHFEDYSSLIGQGIQSYTDENVIAHHVAQYEEFLQQVPGSVKIEKNDGRIVYRIKYYKYVAVKSVDIYTPFRVAETQRLELVDTIGIGSAADSSKVKDEMYRVLREDCDAAIDLFRPEGAENYPDVQKELLQGIWNNLSDMDPAKWIVYVINKIPSGEFKNVAAVNSILPKITESFKLQKTTCPVAWVHDVCGADLNDVSDKLINPLLELISENLDELDEMLMRRAEQLSTDAYNQCLSLVRSANSVISSSANMNSSMLSQFDVILFPSLIKDLGRSLNQIDEMGYAEKKDQPCAEMEQEYKRIINEIETFIPDENVIKERFLTGAAITPTMLFEEFVEQLRNDLFTAFESANVKVLKPLQEKVKLDLIQVLYTQGKMSRLPISDDIQPASIEWLKEIIDQYVSREEYPSLYAAMSFILDYQINIEGLVEYNVTRSLYVIDRTNKEFIPYRGSFAESFDERADTVWQELCNRIDPVTVRMKKWFDDFTLIPSHSFYSRVHKFHMKVMTDKQGVKELRDFYRNNMGLIWNEELIAACQAEKAFGDWSGRVKDLQSKIICNNFKINS